MKASTLAGAFLLITASQIVQGDISDVDRNLHDWQLRRLMEPTLAERDQEQKGRVYIYDSLTDREVNQALDGHFHRMQNMMFMGTVKTGTSGQPQVNPTTGQAELESSRCSE